jgi:hypothetical protein
MADPKENLNKIVTVKCKSDSCTNLVTNRIGRAIQGIYCEECRLERKREVDRNYHDRHKHDETYKQRKRHHATVSYWENKLEN